MQLAVAQFAHVVHEGQFLPFSDVIASLPILRVKRQPGSALAELLLCLVA